MAPPRTKAANATKLLAPASRSLHACAKDNALTRMHTMATVDVNVIFASSFSYPRSTKLVHSPLSLITVLSDVGVKITSDDVTWP